jgi:hypothetical protein
MPVISPVPRLSFKKSEKRWGGRKLGRGFIFLAPIFLPSIPPPPHPTCKAGTLISHAVHIPNKLGAPGFFLSRKGKMLPQSRESGDSRFLRSLSTPQSTKSQPRALRQGRKGREGVVGGLRNREETLSSVSAWQRVPDASKTKPGEMALVTGSEFGHTMMP